MLFLRLCYFCDLNKEIGSLFSDIDVQSCYDYKRITSSVQYNQCFGLAPIRYLLCLNVCFIFSKRLMKLSSIRSFNGVLRKKYMIACNFDRLTVPRSSRRSPSTAMTERTCVPGLQRRFSWVMRGTTTMSFTFTKRYCDTSRKKQHPMSLTPYRNKSPSILDFDIHVYLNT